MTLSGFAIDNPLRTKGDLNLWCNSSTYNVVEVVHLSWLLCVVELLISGLPKLDE